MITVKQQTRGGSDNINTIAFPWSLGCVRHNETLVEHLLAICDGRTSNTNDSSPLIDSVCVCSSRCSSDVICLGWQLLRWSYRWWFRVGSGRVGEEQRRRQSRSLWLSIARRRWGKHYGFSVWLFYYHCVLEKSMCCCSHRSSQRISWDDENSDKLRSWCQ